VPDLDYFAPLFAAAMPGRYRRGVTDKALSRIYGWGPIPKCSSQSSITLRMLAANPDIAEYLDDVATARRHPPRAPSGRLDLPQVYRRPRMWGPLTIKAFGLDDPPSPAAVAAIYETRPPDYRRISLPHLANFDVFRLFLRGVPSAVFERHLRLSPEQVDTEVSKAITTIIETRPLFRLWALDVDLYCFPASVGKNTGDKYVIPATGNWGSWTSVARGMAWYLLGIEQLHAAVEQQSYAPIKSIAARGALETFKAHPSIDAMFTAGEPILARNTRNKILDHRNLTRIRWMDE